MAFSGFCRECLAQLTEESDACDHCGALNLVSHAEIFDLAIAHLDCDAFYAAIEKRDNPGLADKPVIVGGGVRGVVSTCCYIARTYGVRSAMPMFKALRACPDAVVIKPEMAKYVAVGKQIREMMNALTPLVQPLSIDEAFMDLSGTERIHGSPPAITLARLQKKIASELGVTASIGLSHNKFLAKIASDYDKPNGFTVVGRSETQSFLAQLPVSAIWGVGKVMQARLKRDGLTTIAELQRCDQSDLARRYGELGLRLAKLSRGEDYRKVSTTRETKSISSETTFNTDIADIADLEDRLWTLCERVSERMKESGYVGQVITLKLKTAQFQTRTRQCQLAAPSNLARTAFAAARRLLQNAAKGEAYRLIGVAYSDLSPDASPLEQDLFGDEAKLSAQEEAIDLIRDRFGRDAVEAGRAWNRNWRRANRN